MSEARRRVVATVRRWATPIAPDVVETLELLAGEVIANAVVHSGSSCRVAVSWTGDFLRVEVEDPGPALVLTPASVPDDAESGRGLQLVECLATRWGSRPTPEGKAVWFEIDGRTPATSRTPSGSHSRRATGPVLPRAASTRLLPQSP